jgi:hypothetical protein
MPDRRRATCRVCGRHRKQVGPISWGGYCGDCGRELMLDNIDAMHAKSGVPWQRYRFGLARSLLGPEAANALFAAGFFDVGAGPAAEQTAA